MKKQACFLVIILLQLIVQVNSFAQDAALKALLQKNASHLGITATEIDDAEFQETHTDPGTNITFVYLQQTYQHIKVFNSIIKVAFRNGSYLYSSGTFIHNMDSKNGRSTPVVAASDALKAAVHVLKLNELAPVTLKSNLFIQQKKYIFSSDQIAKRDIEVTLVWQQDLYKQDATLAWNVNIDVKDSVNWWNVRIDANTGNFLEKDDWTVEEKSPLSIEAQTPQMPSVPVQKQLEMAPVQKRALQNFKSKVQYNYIYNAPPPNVTSATYNVIPYPVESINYGAIKQVNNPWLMAGATNNAVTHGWHYDGTDNYIITRGNNVFAFLDRSATNVPNATTNWPDTSTTAAPSLTFINTPNFSAQPGVTVTNQKFALDNLFYWNNLMHDVFYQYGFTEAAANFQRDNLGRGGVGNDWVNAQAQDGAGLSNANFSTPLDGLNGRMRMYLFTAPPIFTINTPMAIAGNYASLENAFTSPNKLINTGPKTANIVLYNDDSLGTIHRGCLPATNGEALTGKIAMIDAFGGTGCTTYTYKVKNAQNAGAIAVIIYSSTSSLLNIGGTDNTITIPVITVTNATGNTIINQLISGPVNATIASGIYLDGDLDNAVVCHEYGHGISSRLTGGPASASCLTNAEQGGEGWSDYFALMMTTNWATANLTDGSLARPTGTYVLGQSAAGGGIRRYPYSTNMSIDPLTYANVAASTEVHNIGEVWCSALWDMTWNIIQQQASITTNLYNSGGSGGNVIALNLVVTGLKLQPCGPGFLDARNAILAADSILYNSVHKCAIWNAFARRGMGFSALQGSAGVATDQTPASDVPSGIVLSRMDAASVNSGSSITINQSATCACQPLTGYTIRDTIPAGFNYIGSIPAGTLNGNVLSFPASNFNTLETKDFSITLAATMTGCTIDSVINDNRDTSMTGGFSSTSTGAGGAWNPSTVRSHTPSTSWFGNTPATISTSSLTSASFSTPAQKNLSILSFWHYYNTENSYDGGVVEYSTDGTTWMDASALFVKNGYSGIMDTSTVLKGRNAFTGNNGNFVQSLINFSSFNDLPLSVRFRITSDNGRGVEGWYIDDIIRANGCGGMLKAAAYNNANNPVDSIKTPIFVKPNSIFPVTLLWFYANPVGNQVALDWKTVSEINVKNFSLEYSKDGVSWIEITTVPAQNGSRNNYNFIHSAPVQGFNYYRLKMNDADGKYTYSPVRVVKMDRSNKQLMVLIPNPSDHESSLYISPDLKTTAIRIFDAAGGLVQKIPVANGVQKININTSLLTPGIYVVEANKNNQKQIIKLLVQH